MKKLVSAAVAAACLAIPTAASANGPCGQDFDGNHACGVNSPATIDGSLVTDNESDYYVFHAAKGTELSVSVTDTEAPSCSQSYTSGCGSVYVELTDNKGNGIEQTEGSSPNNGISVPANFSHTLDANGTYYLIVRGQLGNDANDNPTSVPYQLSVSASPSVQWPPPAPPQGHTPTAHKVKVCTVKKVRRRRHHHWVKVRVRTCKTVTKYY
jgi:opacity protein-like surface antigen